MTSEQPRGTGLQKGKDKMSVGIFIDGRRPKSKKEIREVLAGPDGDQRVAVEATSLFGNDPDGRVIGLAPGRIDFVGPDPYRKRNFYGNLFIEGEVGSPERKVTVK